MCKSNVATRTIVGGDRMWESEKLTSIMIFNDSCISAFLEQVGPQIPFSQPSVVGEKVVVLPNPREDFS